MMQKAVRTKEGWLGVGVNGVHVPGVETLPELWKWTTVNKPLADAFHYLHNGRWIAISTDEFDQELKALAVALHLRGISQGDTVGIIASPSPWWLMMDFALQSIGAISVPLFPNISEEHFDYQVENSDTKYLFIEQDRDLSDPIRAKLNNFKHVIALRATRSGYTPLFFYDLIEEGKEALAKDPTLYEKIQPQISGEDVATIIYTSGSSGTPKGIQLTHRNIISQLRSIWGRFPLRHREDIALSGLPLAHSFERTIVYYYVSCGIRLYFADDTRRLGELLQGVHPHILTVVPRLLEKVVERMEANAEASKPLVRFFIEQAIRYAKTHPPRIISPATPRSYIRSPLHLFFDIIVYRKMRAALGGNLTLVVCGGAKLASQTQSFFLNIGLPVGEGYGLTEASPVVSVNEPWDNCIGSIGYPLPEVEVKVSEEGELQVRGGNVMKGILDNPARTAEMIDSEGWLHTGDHSTIDENGRIFIIGRLKELFKTSNGKYVSPLPIEHALSDHPLIDMAMVIADQRKFPTALLFPSEEKYRSSEKSKGEGALSYAQFWKSEEALLEVEKHVNQVNQTLNSWEQIGRWRIITELPSIDNGQLTPTLKIRRPIVEKVYSALINEMYSD